MIYSCTPVPILLMWRKNEFFSLYSCKISRAIYHTHTKNTVISSVETIFVACIVHFITHICEWLAFGPLVFLSWYPTRYSRREREREREEMLSDLTETRSVRFLSPKKSKNSRNPFQMRDMWLDRTLQQPHTLLKISSFEFITIQPIGDIIQTHITCPANTDQSLNFWLWPCFFSSLSVFLIDCGGILEKNGRMHLRFGSWFVKSEAILYRCNSSFLGIDRTQWFAVDIN